MLKAFLDSRHAEDVAFWEKYFSVQSFEYLVRSFDCDPIRPLIERYCSGGALVLEGGCGLGNYVACLRRIGSRPVGLDFGFSMLSEFKRIEPASLLTAGDVSALPFRDGVFDVYYSGGVVEHFEGFANPLETWIAVHGAGALAAVDAVQDRRDLEDLATGVEVECVKRFRSGQRVHGWSLR